ncbi:MAG: hypothetical protein J6X88_01330 [Bacteroidales bacterium]|nr:hypothetical protein [Bacteroidales bacterium]
MLDEISFRKREIEQLSNNNIQLSFQPSLLKSIILHKHKLNTQEVEAALSLADASKKELLTELEFLTNILNSETRLSASWFFAENRLKCFQLESNGMFYGALEGLCSFPLRSLDIYEQQRTRIKYLPTEIGLNKRKKDYLQLQEIEFQKAENLIKLSGEQINLDGEKVDFIGEQLFSREINLFFAGSKELQTERDIFSNVVSQLQTKWKDKNINIYGYSYQNFEHRFEYKGHQCTYNDFIRKFTDIMVFVLNGNVGGETEKEFNLAMSTFRATGKPSIFVYSKVSDSYNEKVEATRKRANEEAQYWQDYSDNDHLRLLIQNDLSDQMQKVYEEIIAEKKKVLG